MDDPKKYPHSKALSAHLQQVASELQLTLDTAAGTAVSFVLLIEVEGVAQYLSNCERSSSVEFMREYAKRLEGTRADIPPHYNPDLH